MGSLDDATFDRVKKAKLFVVGAGGIGCELLKNLVLTGFREIQVIDLDTIDVSNLNRQFLFQKKHVGMSKAQVAKESVLKLCPTANIIAIHDSIFNPAYNMQFFKQFDLVLNALDNRAARNHVNRMCLAANIPLVESGSAGYLGQVTVIKKQLTECYECNPVPRQKTYPGCTIRNTPSELIHCIVWAKYLFNQLFGEEDADQDVSPDTEDPEAKDSESNNAFGDVPQKQNTATGIIQRKSTREWARECDYDPALIFNKLFCNDIKYLLSMDKLWKKRNPPVPLSWEDTDLMTLDEPVSSNFQSVLSVKENAMLFASSLSSLKQLFKSEGDGGILVWDKDDTDAMNFVSTAANIRAHIYNIPQKSGFEVKSMAGNIIPAIATTNAIVAGLIVMQALCIIQDEIKKCKSVFVCKAVNAAKKLINPCSLDPPKPTCYVCADKPEITIKLDINSVSVADFRERVLKQKLGMLAPDVEILDGRGTILISSDDEDDVEENLVQPLSNFSITHGARLRADDFLQNYDIVINLLQDESLAADQLFDIVETTGDVSAKPVSSNLPSLMHEQPASTSTEEDDVLIVDIDDCDVVVQDKNRKRKTLDNGAEEGAPSKKPKLTNDKISHSRNGDNCDVVLLD